MTPYFTEISIHWIRNMFVISDKFPITYEFVYMTRTVPDTHKFPLNARIRMRCERMRCECERMRCECARISCECAHMRAWRTRKTPKQRMRMLAWRMRNAFACDANARIRICSHCTRSHRMLMRACARITVDMLCWCCKYSIHVWCAIGFDLMRRIRSQYQPFCF